VATGRRLPDDLHKLLVERYGLKPSVHMSTEESLGILFFICSGNESNRKCQNRFKHSGETISRKFEDVLFCLMDMAKELIRPKDPNFHTMHRRIRDDKRAYLYLKTASEHLMAHIFVFHFHRRSK
jgi:hypothetical protein